MINKELLGEVLNQKVEYIETDPSYIHFNIDFDIPENVILYYTNKWEFVNIHELAYLCKKWAWNQGYEIVGTVTNVEVKFLKYGVDCTKTVRENELIINWELDRVFYSHPVGIR